LRRNSQGKKGTGILVYALLFAAFLAVPSLSAQEAAEDPFAEDFFSTDFFTVDTPSEEPLESGDFSEKIIEEEDLDSLFLDEAMIEELDQENQNPVPTEDFLKTERLVWGGTFQGSIESSLSWDNLGSVNFKPLDPPGRSLTPRVGVNLFFDARPTSDYRAFGKLKLETTEDFLSGLGDLSSLSNNFRIVQNEDGSFSIVFQEEEEDEDAEEEEYEPGTGNNPSLNLSIFELFADFSYKEKLFFRFGKHTIKWGVGYFFSPADVLNLTSLDAEDPTADREGPLSLKVQYPFGLNNLYLYLITNSGIRPSETALAPKIEFLYRGTEYSLAAYYQRALSPRIIGSFTRPSGDFTFFGEGVVSYGSDRVYVRPSKDQSRAEEDEEGGLEMVLDTYKIEDLPIALATVGFLYLNADSKVTFAGQYFFNGEGYKNSELLKPAYRLLANSTENGLYIAEVDARPEGYGDPPALSQRDLVNFSRHYIALSAGKSELFEKDLSLNLFGLCNLTDLSGIASVNVSYSFFDYLSITGGIRFTFGGPQDEYTNPQALRSGEKAFPTLAFTLSLSLGNRAF